MKTHPYKKIVLLSSGQPSLNPRLVKEADTLAQAGYRVTVIYQYWNDWATAFDKTLLTAKKWKAVRVGGAPADDALKYKLFRIIHKAARVAVHSLGFRFGMAELAIGRCAALLYREALKQKADLYIAHNLAALPAAVNAAGKLNVECGFDAEDFHRNEVSDNPQEFDVRIKTYIENKYIPLTGYLTASSNQIAKCYAELFPTKTVTTLLNVFPKSAVKAHNFTEGKPLKLFWVSQTVGLNRGIADVIRMMKLLENEAIEFHILGFLTGQVRLNIDGLIEHLKFSTPPVLFFHQPVQPEELVLFASNFHIGLATEPGFSINNNNALSNKIFTYLNAGLALIVSDTAAQKAFINEYPLIGHVYERGDYNGLAGIVKKYIDDPVSLILNQQAAYQASQTVLNWEYESQKFLQLVNLLLND